MKLFNEYKTEILDSYNNDVTITTQILEEFVESIPKPLFIKPITVSVHFDSVEGGYKLSIFNLENTAMILAGYKEVDYCKLVFFEAYKTYFGLSNDFSVFGETHDIKNFTFVINPVISSNK